MFNIFTVSLHYYLTIFKEMKKITIIVNITSCFRNYVYTQVILLK